MRQPRSAVELGVDGSWREPHKLRARRLRKCSKTDTYGSSDEIPDVFATVAPEDHRQGGVCRFGFFAPLPRACNSRRDFYKYGLAEWGSNRPQRHASTEWDGLGGGRSRFGLEQYGYFRNLRSGHWLLGDNVQSE